MRNTWYDTVMSRPDFTELLNYDIFKNIDDFYDGMLSVYDEADLGFPFPICKRIDFVKYRLSIICQDDNGAKHEILFSYPQGVNTISYVQIEISKSLFVDNKLFGRIHFYYSIGEPSSINENLGIKLAEGIVFAINSAKDGIGKEAIDSIVSYFVGRKKIGKPLFLSIDHTRLGLHVTAILNNEQILFSWDGHEFNEDISIYLGKDKQLETKITPELLAVLREDNAFVILNKMKDME
mgnify:FL=1